MSISSTASEPSQIEIDSSEIVQTLAFCANGEHLVGGTSKNFQVWRVKDGKLMATVEANHAGMCLAVSKDGGWIGAGRRPDIVVWDARTLERLFTLKAQEHTFICDMDFSPDSTRLVAVTWTNCVTVWNLVTREPVQQLTSFWHNAHEAVAAKYSLQGDRIATATRESVQIWDSDNGCLLAHIDVKVTPRFNTARLWFSNLDLFVVSTSTIKRFNVSTGSAISEWSPRYGLGCDTSRIALSQHTYAIAHLSIDSEHTMLSFWDTNTHTELGLINHNLYIFSVAWSPDDRLLASSQERKITVMSLARITEPDIHIDHDVLDLWKHDNLTSVEASLTLAMVKSSDSNHHLLASRALVRTRLQHWEGALLDVDMSLSIQPSVVGYIAKSIVHVGQGEKDKGYESCDFANEHFHLPHGNFILLAKAIIMFIAGEHHEAISHMDNLIPMVHFNSICYLVQAYMYFLLGDMYVQRNDYECAIQSFERARAQVQHYGGQPFFAIPLIFGWKLNATRAMIRQSLCDALHAAGRTNDAVECFYQMRNEVEEVKEHQEWALGFRRRCSNHLECLGDTATGAQQYDKAVSCYTTALSLDLPSPEGILVKRRRAFTATEGWKQALDDANKMIMLNRSSPWGYEIKHAALHKAGDYASAVNALGEMLSNIIHHPEPDIQRYGDRYISPSSTRAIIRKIVHRTIRHMPRVLINTTNGRLHDKAQQASAFESLPLFNELVSLMTMRIDHVRIKREVRQYFRYVMLSHKWEANEPLFQQIISMSVFDLGEPSKLHMFCKIVRDAGFTWAWSDTCCINKSDHFVLQEALVAMFRWYQDSALVIVFLRGVRRSSGSGALAANLWNTRAWTLQEYIAAKVVRFYTEDWTPYLDLRLPNHKEVPEILSEMKQATGVSAEELIALRPGLTSIREKLRLASVRRTTLVEDAAYSLLGIFSVAGIPAIYGEGDGSLGRLLAHVTTISGDASTLAWTGESGSFNSCLPARVSVFQGPATSHLPPPVPDDDMETTIVPPTSPFDIDPALKLYDRLSELPAPWFAASRMKLPCIAFQLPPLTSYRTRLGHVYRVATVTFGMVEIKTRHDLSRMKPLYLVHPWLDALLERGATHGGTIVDDEVALRPLTPDSDDGRAFDEESDDHESNEGSEDYHSAVSELESPLLSPPHTAAPMDTETQARRFVARLQQPFGALLLTLASKGRLGIDYRRVAADSMVTVQFQKSVSLADLLDHVRTFDVL